MIVAPAGVKVHLALGHTDMRKGLDGLATLIQEHLKKDPRPKRARNSVQVFGMICIRPMAPLSD